ncbi:hypothetical protein [Jiangella alba]|uniref:hypothetical protein n=1 Tax=Jiangella alba TaxID=561176 RepID=UPI00083F1325|nr:hypothetical protein [Jiangella alba]
MSEAAALVVAGSSIRHHGDGTSATPITQRSSSLELHIEELTVTTAQSPNSLVCRQVAPDPL